jgi:hypothetical protein
VWQNDYVYFDASCVEIRLQMIQKSNKLKYYFNTFVLISKRHLCDKGSRTQWIEYKLIWDIIENDFLYFCDFMSWNNAINGTKLE